MNATMKKRIQHILHELLLGLILFLGFLSALLYNAAKWVVATWGLLTVDEVIYHLKAPLEGTNSDMVWDFIITCVPGAAIFLILLLAVFLLTRGKKKIRTLCMTGSVLLSALFLYLGGSLVWEELAVGAYVEAQLQESTFIEDHYADPKTVQLTFPEEKRNLIYIFLESMEATYMSTEDGGAFEENVIPELTALAEKNISFSNGENGGGLYVPYGATWTMGAMFAHTSGLPLKINIEQNSMSEQEEFFPDITTLGDILKDAGYQQELLIGSDAVFGGRRNYFKQHGEFEIMDHPKARWLGMLPPDYSVFWGYEDEKLFQFAKDELTRLSSEDAPFNLTMLTVDTHFEDGYTCPLCPDTYDDPYANVMACSSRQLSEFIQWIQEQPFYENTTIILAGDHLTMDSDFCEDVGEDYDRTVYNGFINAPITADNTKNRTATTFDLFPTTLACLGVEIDGERLGLGTNLFSDVETWSEQVGIASLDQELTMRSAFMEAMTENLIELNASAIGENQDQIQVTLKKHKTDENEKIIFSAYTSNNEKKDLQWYDAEEGSNDTWQITFSLHDYLPSNFIRVSAYEKLEDGSLQEIMTTDRISIPWIDDSADTE